MESNIKIGQISGISVRRSESEVRHQSQSQKIWQKNARSLAQSLWLAHAVLLFHGSQFFYLNFIPFLAQENFKLSSPSNLSYSFLRLLLLLGDSEFEGIAFFIFHPSLGIYFLPPFLLLMMKLNASTIGC